MTLAGGATPQGTSRFAARFPRAAAGWFKPAQSWTVASVGLGTYLGQDDDATDRGYADAITRALELGCNVLDSAINYRNQRSELVVGRTLAQLVADSRLVREDVVLASKGGFIPFESGYPGGIRRYVDETFLRPGIITANDIVGGVHCMTPRYLRHQLDSSRRNLGCDVIDIYYVHNPETQLAEVGRQEFADRMRDAFEALEGLVAEGKIGVYGTATWNAYRVTPAAPDFIALEELVRCAVEVGGEGHHFRALQLPFNLAMPEAFTAANQPHASARVPLLRLAAEMGFTVMASASLLQARLARNLPAELHSVLNGGLRSDAQRALQFARSVPGLTTALVGMSNPAHAEENLALMAVGPLTEERFARLFA